MSVLEKQYPHVSKNIHMMWGSYEGRKYLIHLLNDTRDGTRAGFTSKAAAEIFQYLSKHDIEYPYWADTTYAPYKFNNTRKQPKPKPKKSNTLYIILILAALIIMTIYFM